MQAVLLKLNRRRGHAWYVLLPDVVLASWVISEFPRICFEYPFNTAFIIARPRSFKVQTVPGNRIFHNGYGHASTLKRGFTFLWPLVGFMSPGLNKYTALKGSFVR